MQGYANDDQRADGPQKDCRFGVSTWNVDSLTGRAGEVEEALSDRKVDVACIQETWWKVVAAISVELKAKDISCSGWEVRRDPTV